MTEEKVNLSVSISLMLEPEDDLDSIIDDIYEALEGAGIEVEEVELLNVPEGTELPETFFDHKPEIVSVTADEQESRREDLE